jgi:hypothetical protein
MRRFWWLVGLSVSIVVGLVLGVLITFVSVIIPRSAELKRPRPLTALVRTLDMGRLIRQSTDSTINWEILEDPVRSGPSYNSLVPEYSILVRGRAELPSATHEVILGRIYAQLNASLTGGAYISWSNSSTERKGESLFWEQAFTYVAGNQTGRVDLVGLGQGDHLVVMIIASER